MKLYESTMAPNPRRVRIFLSEKGVEVPIEQVDIATASEKPAFVTFSRNAGRSSSEIKSLSRVVSELVL